MESNAGLKPKDDNFWCDGTAAVDHRESVIASIHVFWYCCPCSGGKVSKGSMPGNKMSDAPGLHA